MLRKHVGWWISALLMVAVLLVPLAFGANSTSVASEQTLAAPSRAAPTVSSRNISFVSAPGEAEDESMTLVDLYRTVNSSVVEVVNLADGGRFSQAPVEQGLGSGFVWDAEGHIVTNDHVVAGADALQVVFADGTRVDATLTGTDPSSDLAVIKVDPRAADLNPVILGDISQVEVGQEVVAIGNPYGRQGTMTVGIVSGLGRTISSQTDYSIPNAIQTDAAINPGNSGGPLLNRQGEVIGVNDQIETTTGSNTGVGFAIPISIVQRVVPALIEDGRYGHAYLGISGSTYNVNWASALDLPEDARGVYIMGLVQGGPAQQAGLSAGTQNSGVMLELTTRGPEYLPGGGDLITAIDGQTVTSMDELMIYLSEHTSPGQTVELTVLRTNGAEASLEVKLGVQPGNAVRSASTG